ncbi:hypothetical protein I3843_02G171700 [Carya illinoinensis]|uniref:Protein kinase domain-containing protein n=1 Tax=Carya illinoinensis TaxID=32201 RepID=A0A922FUL6_CARIL|nr:hypothetical protein I3760_02G195200 [Carya illinoinensis]KAG6728806.1 hypothetical protein I3842_02G192200 [Carya illinoinensis]KAG7993295.1 hypothetical protein I3843_02G171700 [Carya illinoinensis]
MRLRMDGNWNLGQLLGVVVVCFLCQNLHLSCCLNDEGLALLRFRQGVMSDPFGALLDWKEEDGEVDPCSWFGVECSDGKVVALNLKDLCLRGTLAPELAKLVQMKFIILRNNSFSGIIPEGIGELKELEILDLGYNNFSGPLPPEFGCNVALTTLLVDNNDRLGDLPPDGLMLSESQADENRLSNAAQGSSCHKRSVAWNVAQTEDTFHRRLLVNGDTKSQTIKITPPPPSIRVILSSPSPSPFPSPSPSPEPKAEGNFPTPTTSPPSHPSSVPSPAGSPPSSTSSHLAAILAGAIGGAILISAICVYLCKSNKVAAVKPWATGLSGQLQKAFVTGVPKLKRSDLEAACEDFSNVIGSSPIGTVYKGTLSSGVEIAVASVGASAKDWSNSLEAQFRRKIDTLSKVNHKNFVNLLGYCQEDEPFTRMMVFEYAPNGTLFEHLHNFFLFHGSCSKRG